MTHLEVAEEEMQDWTKLREVRQPHTAVRLQERVGHDLVEGRTGQRIALWLGHKKVVSTGLHKCSSAHG